MTVKYRTVDLAKWGSGEGRNLYPVEVDTNFWELAERIVALEALPGQPAAIESFEVAGTEFLVHLTDDTTLGPYTLPVWRPEPRGEWLPTTAYYAGDWITVNGGIYEVNIDHTSDASFDPGANNGLGDDYYILITEAPGSSLPEGGADGQVLAKTSGANYAVTWEWKLPADGVAGDYIRKVSSSPDDAEWTGILAEDVDFTPPTGSHLLSENVADALVEISEASGVSYEPTSGSGVTATNVQDAIDELASGSAGGAVGKQTISISASGMRPALSFGATPGVFETSTHKRVIQTLDFDVGDEAQFEIAMPKSWDPSTPITAQFFWSHPATTVDFDVQWRLRAGSVYDGAPLDAGLDSFDTVLDDGGTTDTLYITDELEDGIYVVDDVVGNPATFDSIVTFSVIRQGGDLAVEARLHAIRLYYVTNAGTDD